MNNSLIEQFSQLKPKQKAEEFYQVIVNIISNALADIADKLNLNAQNIRIFAMGEYTSDTYIDETGELEIVIANSDPQMLIANKTYLKQYKEAKTKKQRQILNTKGTSDELIKEFYKSLIDYFSQNSTLILTNNGIKVLCKKEYNFNAFIKIGTFDQLDQEYKISFWNVLTKTEQIIDVFKYHEILDTKDKVSNGNFKKVVRILKNLRKTMLLNKWISSSGINRYFVEMLALNIPDKLLKGQDIFKVYSKAILFLSNCDLQDFKDYDKNLLVNNKLANVDYNKIKKFLYYANQILE